MWGEDLRWEQWGEKKRDKAKSKLFKLLIELKAKHTHTNENLSLISKVRKS